MLDHFQTTVLNNMKCVFLIPFLHGCTKKKKNVIDVLFNITQNE
jgi:hypothetical protein